MIMIIMSDFHFYTNFNMMKNHEFDFDKIWRIFIFEHGSYIRYGYSEIVRISVI